MQKGFIDLHCHILPGLDDGSKKMEESLRTLTLMKDNNFNTVVCTPHIRPGMYDNKPENIQKVFQEFKEKSSDIEINLSLGAEHYLCEEVMEMAEKNSLLAYANQKRYFLLELPSLFPLVKLNEIIFNIQRKGYTPVIAHPERYDMILSDIEKIIPLYERGCILQVNLKSLNWWHGGRKISKTAKKLLERGLIHILATDNHKEKDCGKAFLKGLKSATNIIGEEGIDLLLHTNPAKILNGDNPDEVLSLGEV